MIITNDGNFGYNVIRSKYNCIRSCNIIAWDGISFRPRRLTYAYVAVVVSEIVLDYE